MGEIITAPVSAWRKWLIWGIYLIELATGLVGTAYGLYLVVVFGVLFSFSLALSLSYLLLLSGGYLYAVIRMARSPRRYHWPRWLPCALGVPLVWAMLAATMAMLRGF